MFVTNLAKKLSRLVVRQAKPIGLCIGIAAGMSLMKSEHALMYTDNIFEKAKGLITTEIEKLRNKHGEQMMSFPQVNYSAEAGIYKMDFLVDQRKCDIF